MGDDTELADAAVSGADYRLLLQIALLGTEMGEVAHAKDIAETLQKLRPDLPHACIVLAMSDFCAGSKTEGIRALQDTLERFPSSQLATAMLAVCLMETGGSGWQQMLESVIDDGRDEYAIGLACAILGRSKDAGKPPDAAVPAAHAHAVWA